MKTEEIKRIAKLARLEIPPERLESFSAEFEKILDYFKKMDAADVEGVEPFTFTKENVFREDEPQRDAEIRKRILDNAPDRQDDYFRVKKVIE